MRVFASPFELPAAAGEELGTTEWAVVDQPRIDRFAEATGDHQWIHVDPERAKDGPFGRTIAHGLLTLSLLPSFLQQLYRVDGVTMAINYGLNKVRFPAPAPVGARLRASSRIADAAEKDGTVQVTLSTTIEIEESDKPACVVESVVRYVP
ncbi:Acyl dehydratase [Haloechinothrix alba]|uniref:Acyl dehydratase n=1 Tax=Haloechinothrix alba TaxID=664784 RepID=A0A238ZHN4_9PSEU|nr:MaoC family dehydratase [Haloechinothrix alba]SNR82976.1 Acyl dehydratase [Haloechinothrix alba]